MIDMLNGLVSSVGTLVGNLAYVVAAAITIAVFARTKAFAQTAATAIVAFAVAYVVQPANLQRLAGLVGQDLGAMIPPLPWF